MADRLTSQPEFAEEVCGLNLIVVSKTFRFTDSSAATRRVTEELALFHACLIVGNPLLNSLG